MAICGLSYCSTRYFFLVVTFYVAYFGWHLWKAWRPTDQLGQISSLRVVDTPKSCVCMDNNTGITYDFCYKFPFNQTIRGRRFSCQWVPILKSLDLLGDNTDFAFRGSLRFDHDVPFVSAASQFHFPSLLVLIDSVQRLFGSKQRFIFFDLGLKPEQSELIQRLCNVEYRVFDFSGFPESIRRLYEFRWKPLIIAKALQEFDSIWYMDSSVKLESNNLSEVYALFNCSHKTKWTNQDRSRQRGKGTCEKFPYLLHAATGHGIFSATHPDLYHFFPTDIGRLKRRTCEMFEAGLAFIVRTQPVRELLKWNVLCALERDCMGPPAATGACEFNAIDRFTKYAKCHRFDQSVLNLLLANLHGCDSYFWSSGVRNRFFKIGRGQKLPVGGKEKLKLC